MDDFLESLLDFIIDSSRSVSLDPDYLIVSDGSLEIVNSVWAYLRLIGIGLTLVYFLAEINRMMVFEGRDVTYKTVLVPFLKLALAYFVLSKGALIVSWILTFNNTLISYADANFLGTSAGLGTAGISSEGIIDGMGFWEKILFVIPCLLLWFCTVILSLVFIYKSFTYKLELLLRTCFAPVALADIYSGQHANAVRYLKGFLAHVLYGACFIIIPRMGNSLFVADMDSMIFSDGMSYIIYFFFCLLAPLAEIGILSAAKQVTKEALG